MYSKRERPFAFSTYLLQVMLHTTCPRTFAVLVAAVTAGRFRLIITRRAATWGRIQVRTAARRTRAMQRTCFWCSGPMCPQGYCQCSPKRTAPYA